MVEQERWAYFNQDQSWSVMVTQDSVVLQTTSYERFEGFAERLHHATSTVLGLTEHDKLGRVERVGLRYIDLIQPGPDEDFRLYLRPGFHGVSDQVFRPGTHRLHIESAGNTKVGDEVGTMIVRILQNDQGYSLPPDLIGAAPAHASRAGKGELVTLIDIDHFIEGNFQPDTAWVVERAYEMHDHVIETFHEHVVTREAIEAWR